MRRRRRRRRRRRQRRQRQRQQSKKHKDPFQIWFCNRFSKSQAAAAAAASSLAVCCVFSSKCMTHAFAFCFLLSAFCFRRFVDTTPVKPVSHSWKLTVDNKGKPSSSSPFILILCLLLLLLLIWCRGRQHSRTELNWTELNWELLPSIHKRKWIIHPPSYRYYMCVCVCVWFSLFVKDRQTTTTGCWNGPHDYSSIHHEESTKIRLLFAPSINSLIFFFYYFNDNKCNEIVVVFANCVVFASFRINKWSGTTLMRDEYRLHSTRAWFLSSCPPFIDIFLLVWWCSRKKNVYCAAYTDYGLRYIMRRLW